VPLPSIVRNCDGVCDGVCGVGLLSRWFTTMLLFSTTLLLICIDSSEIKTVWIGGRVCASPHSFCISPCN
jgi:hypothetical protein